MSLDSKLLDSWVDVVNNKLGSSVFINPEKVTKTDDMISLELIVPAMGEEYDKKVSAYHENFGEIMDKKYTGLDSIPEINKELDKLERPEIPEKILGYIVLIIEASSGDRLFKFFKGTNLFKEIRISRNKYIDEAVEYVGTFSEELYEEHYKDFYEED